jgi:hypothetical protein
MTHSNCDVQTKQAEGVRHLSVPASSSGHRPWQCCQAGIPNIKTGTDSPPQDYNALFRENECHPLGYR